MGISPGGQNKFLVWVCGVLNGGFVFVAVRRTAVFLLLNF